MVSTHHYGAVGAMRAKKAHRLTGVSDLLRGEETLACVHKVALTRGATFDFTRPETSPEMAVSYTHLTLPTNREV